MSEPSLKRFLRSAISIICYIFLSSASPLFAELLLDGSIKQESIYFSSTKRLRSHLYTLRLSQIAEYSTQTQIVTTGHVSYDAALSSSSRGQWTYPVKTDEMFEAKFTQFYLRYLANVWSLKLGLQTLDWIETLTQQGPDFLIPLDIRRGGIGIDSDNVLPMLAAKLGHSFLFESSLEWIYVPTPVVSRLPKGPNGYGYYENLSENIPDGKTLVPSETKPSSKLEDAEFGLRLIKNIESFDFSVFGYHGHQRLPSYIIRPTLSANSIGVEQHYSLVDTYGFFSSWSRAKSVSRFYALYEPLKQPSIAIVGIGNNELRSSGSYKHLRVGIGEDYAFSKHFKLYSEVYLSKKDFTSPANDQEDLNTSPAKDYSLSYRLTNESFENLTLILDGVVTWPERSYFLGPSFSAKIFNDYRLSGGMHYFKSFSDLSRLDLLRKSSHYFLAFEYLFQESSKTD